MNLQNTQINVSSYLSIIPKNREEKVDLPVEAIGNSSALNKGLFDVSSHCIIEGFRFTLADGDSTPTYTIFSINKDGYIRLVNSSFQRGVLIEGQTAKNLASAIFTAASQNSTSSYVLVNLIFCTFDSLTFDNESIIKSNGAAFSFTNFTNIQKISGNGSVISLSGSGALVVTDCLFTNCTSLNGNGGAIYASVNGTGFSFIGNRTITSFSNCSASNTTLPSSSFSSLQSNAEGMTNGYGGAIYIEGNITQMNIVNTTFDSSNATKNTAVVDGNQIFIMSDQIERVWDKRNVPFMASIKVDNKDYSFKLLTDDANGNYSLLSLFNRQLVATQSHVYLGGYKPEQEPKKGKRMSNQETQNCQEPSNPCQDIVHALSLIKFGTRNVTIVDSFYLNVTAEVSSGDFIMRGNNNTNNTISSIVVNYTGAIVISVNSSIENLAFLLPSQVDNSSKATVMDHSLLTIRGEVASFKSISFSSVGEGKSFNTYSLISCSSQSIIIDQCIFGRITRVSNEKNTILSVVQLNSKNVTVKNSMFEGCSNVDGHGGALYIDTSNYRPAQVTNGTKAGPTPSPPPFISFGSFNFRRPVLLTIQNCTFSSCVGREGGAICMNINEVPQTFTLTDVMFGRGDEKNVGSFGDNLFLCSSILPLLATKEFFPFLEGRSELDDTYIGSFSFNKDYTANDVYSLVIYVNNIRKSAMYYVGGKGGSNNNDCLTKNTACRTLQHVIYDTHYYINNITIVDQLMLRDEEVHIAGIGCNIKGETNKVTVSAGSKSRINATCFTSISTLNITFPPDFENYDNASFINGYSVLSLSSITFYCLQNGTRLKSGLISVTGGILDISGCTFSGFTTDEKEKDKNLIISDCVIFKINSSTFDNLVRTEGNGGALSISFGNYTKHVTIGEEGTVTTFKRCSATTSGGAIYIDANLNLTLYPSFVLSSLTFGASTEGNSAASGKNVFISSNYLFGVSNKNFLPSLLKEVEGGGGFQGVSTDKSDNKTYDLVSLLNGKEGSAYPMLYVGNLGDDNHSCTDGAEQLCKTLDAALKLVTSGLINITFVGNITTNGTSLFGQGYQFIGDIVKTYVCPDKQLSFAIYTDTLFQTIKFALNETVKDVLLNVHYGTLNLSIVSFVNDRFLGYHPYSLISLSMRGSAVLEDCLFDNAMCYNSNGGAISSTLSFGNSLLIKGCEFINCRVADNNGGAISSELERGKFVIQKSSKGNTIFKGCSARNEYYDYTMILNERGYKNTGNGGAIYLFVRGEPDQLLVGDVEFGGEEIMEKNMAQYGYDIFVKSFDLQKTMTKEHFPYLNKMGSKYDGLMGVQVTMRDGFEMVEGEPQSYNDVKSGGKKGGSKWWVALIVILVIGIIAGIVIAVVVFVVKGKGGFQKMGNYNYNRSPGYGPPNSNPGYAPASDSQGYTPPTATSGYAPPTATSGYAPPTATQDYPPPDSNTISMTTSINSENVATENSDMPIPQ